MEAAGLAGSQVVIAGTLCMLAPETTVEQQDALREPAKKRLGMLSKIKNHNAKHSNADKYLEKS